MQSPRQPNTKSTAVPFVSQTFNPPERTLQKMYRTPLIPPTARPGWPRKGSDGEYKEFKVLSFYDPDKSHCHVVGTAGNHEALGRLMRREARRLRLAEAKTTYAVTDGSEWIAKQYRRQLPMLDEHILDYYHLQEHMVETSSVLYGEGTKKARNWREEMMGCVWEQGSLAMLHRLGPYLRRHRGGPRRAALTSLWDYVGKRVAMTDYPTFRALGYDCGSGMRWDKNNAESIMALAAPCITAACGKTTGKHKREAA